MAAGSPLAVGAGILLILLGVAYPMFTLIRLGQQLGKDTLARRQLLRIVLLNALLPMTAVLAGFWLLSALARQSPVYLGALIAAAILLLLTLFLFRPSGNSGS